jgi:hypothetical protein
MRRRCSRIASIVRVASYVAIGKGDPARVFGRLQAAQHPQQMINLASGGGSA